MDPPARPHKRRVPTGSLSQNAVSGSFTPGGSPSPSISTPKSTPSGTETRRPRSGQTVTLGWEEGGNSSISRLHIDLADVVETKTVTTTTTTKLSYPPILLPHKPLQSLDTKEYPLALIPTPFDLTQISYELDGNLSLSETSSSTHVDESMHITPSQPALTASSQLYQDCSAAESTYHNPKDPVAQRSERSKMKRLSNTYGRSRKSQTEADESSHALADDYPPNFKKADRKGQIGSNGEARRRGFGMRLDDDAQLPVTPDTSGVDCSTSIHARSGFQPFADAFTPQSALSQSTSFDVPSPSHLSQEVFTSAVATPPIAESDLEPLDRVNEALTNAANSASHLPSLNIAAAQNASLPSPGLSPNYSGGFDDGEEDFQSSDSQNTMEIGPPRRRDLSSLTSMLETFDSMTNDMKALVMFNFLKRCPRKTLHLVADTVNPALKCDFLELLPTELSLHLLGFLDHRDLCRAAQVSKKWREIIDSNETGWKELMDQDGFVLPTGELERAVNQGWGWQDPYGSDGYEQDLSVQHGTSFKDSDGKQLTTTTVASFAVRKGRTTTKRKRPALYSSGPDRTKRRVVTGPDLSDPFARSPQTAEFSKSEGPISAASAAAKAILDPQLGLSSLRQLHLFKSLYRRRYMLQRSWTSGKVQPHHFAFPAHPTHVITCLQFDDDKILTGSDDTLIHVYDTRTGALRKKLEGHEGGVWALQYEGNVLVSGSTDRSVRVWDIEKGLCTQVFHGHTSTVRCLQIVMPEPSGLFEEGKAIMMPEKPLIITGSRDSQLRVWRLPEEGAKRYIQTGPPANDLDCPYFVRVLTGHSHSVRAIAAHQDTLVSGSYDNTVRVWKISTGETLHRLQGHSMKVYSVVLDHKRNRCISGSMDNLVKIWCLNTGACLFTLEGHTSLVGLLDLRDERLVSAAADSTLRIWDPESGQCKNTLTAHTGAITCFQHDGQKVISGSDRTLKMWNVKTGECIKDLLTDLSGVWQVKFDERRCVAAVQRDNLTFVEVLDFGASRDGIPAEKRGFRSLLDQTGEDGRIIDDESA